MPQAPKIELMCLGVLPSQVGNRFLGKECSITAKLWLEPYTKKCVRKGEGGKNFG